MLIVYLFMTLTALCCAIAAVCGGWEGKWAGALTVLALATDRAVGSVAMDFAVSPGFRLGLDGALLAGYIAIMSGSRRWWPIWITGFQMNGVLAHLTTWFVPDYTPLMYRGLESVWGIPIVITMALGAALDRRAERAGATGR